MADPKAEKAELPDAPAPVAVCSLSRDEMVNLLMRHDRLTRSYFTNERRLFPGRSVEVSLATSLLAATAQQLSEAGHKPAPLITSEKKQVRPRRD